MRCFAVLAALIATRAGAQPQPFCIHVEAGDAGVSGAKLTTVNSIVLTTDVNGNAACYAPQDVTLTPAPGASAELRVTRRNLAERLYRVTGQGIYRDTVLLGGDGGVSNGGVLGQDSVLSAVYRGTPFFIWGDTNRASYP